MKKVAKLNDEEKQIIERAFERIETDLNEFSCAAIEHVRI